MLMTFDKTSGRATGDYQPGRSHMRGDGGNTPRNPYSSGRQPDAACRGRIAFGVFGFILAFMFILPLILAGIAVKFG